MLTNCCFAVIFTLADVLPLKAQNHKFSVSAGTALAVNNFTWSVAGNSQGQSPNILSELHFNNITSLGLFLNGTYSPTGYIRFDAYYQRNGVLRGNGTDTDYAGDNRTNPTFDQPFSSDAGHLEIFKAGVKSIFLRRQKIKLGAGLAYRNTLQNFVILSPELTTLRSTYTARWRGPDLSIEAIYNISRSISVGADFSYSPIRYKAEANWNLIDIFEHPLSFEQEAKGRSMEVGVNFRYTLNHFLSLSLNGQLGNNSAYRGKDVSYLKNGSQISTQFNGSVNDYSGIRLGADFHF